MNDRTTLAFWAGVTALFFALLVLNHFKRRWHIWRRTRKFRRGLRAEGRAEYVLRRHGYQMFAVQKNVPVSLFVDGEKRCYTVRPDGMARRGKHLYVVEVKTGGVATDPLYRDTRRQMLEYANALPVTGVLLVNGDAETVQEVLFNREVPRQSSRLLWLIFGALMGIAIASWIGL